MAAKVHLKNLDLGKFFRCKRDSTEEMENTEDRKNDVHGNSSNDKTEPDLGETCNKKSDDRKQCEPTDDSDVCKNNATENDVKETELTELIDNSSKEAVCDSVTEVVCPSPNPQDCHGKEVSTNTTDPLIYHAKGLCKTSDSLKSYPKYKNPQDSQTKKTFNKPKTEANQEKENKPKNKSFDSDLFRPLNRLDASSILLHKDQSNKELVNKEQQMKSTQSSKLKERKKVARQTKESSHFRTDNRRMTGNVNIYICSEANGSKKEIEEKDKGVEDSENETKTSDSDLSISTSKLVTALKKKQQRKDLNNQPLIYQRETPEDSKQFHQSDDDNSDDPDKDVLYLREVDQEFSDDQSFSSRGGTCGDYEKSSDLDSDFQNFHRCSSNDMSESRYCSIDDCPSFIFKSFKDKKRQGTKNNQDKCCFCCKAKRFKGDGKILQEKLCHRESNGRANWHKGNTLKSNRCSCVVKEKKDNCCTDKQEIFTVCVNRFVDEKKEPATPQSAYDIPKMIEDTSLKSEAKNDHPPLNEPQTDESEVSKKIEQANDNETEQVGGTVAPEKKKRSSFLYRSFEKAINLMKALKDETFKETENNKEHAVSTQDDQSSQVNQEKTVTENENLPPVAENHSKLKISSDQIDQVNQEKLMSENENVPPVAENRQRSRISSALAIRKGLATGGNSSNVPSNQDQAEAKDDVKLDDKSTEKCDCRNPVESEQIEKSCKYCCSTRKNESGKECCCDRDDSKLKSLDIEECHCDRKWTKPMICVYCDNSRDNCICSPPIKCPCYDCSGRRIVSGRDNKDHQGICGFSWKPRRDGNRYFGNEMSVEDRCDSWKPYGSDGLAYQKRDAFFNVMNELQQKISGSVCCSVCNKEPCCCCCGETGDGEEKAEDKIDMKASPTTDRDNFGKWNKRSRSKLPVDNCKCAPRRRSAGQPLGLSRICDKCRTSPCRCRQNSKSPLKKPQAKCYYCKTSPCTCVRGNETTSDSRPIRNADSSQCRRKERYSSIQENINIDNEDNRYRARDNTRFVPCPGNQQQIRKYCYRENPNGPDTLHPSERVR